MNPYTAYCWAIKSAAYFRPEEVKGLSRLDFAKLLGKDARFPASGADPYAQLVRRPELRHLDANEYVQHVFNHPATSQVRQNMKDYELLADNMRDKSHALHDARITPKSEMAWHHFVVNQSQTAAKTENAEKLYATLHSPENWTATHTHQLLKDLADSGYGGQLKLPTHFSGMVGRFDNIVMHPSSTADVAIADKVLRKHLDPHGASYERGLDRAKTDPLGGASYNQMLADHVKNLRHIETKGATGTHTEVGDAFYNYTGIQRNSPSVATGPVTTPASGVATSGKGNSVRKPVQKTQAGRAEGLSPFATGALGVAAAGGLAYGGHRVLHRNDTPVKQAALPGGRFTGSAYQTYCLMLGKQASAPLALSQGLWKGTVLGAVPGAAIGAYKGRENNPDHPLTGALTGAAVGGFVGGVAGRGAQYGSRVYRVGRELEKHKALDPELQKHMLFQSKLGPYLAGGMLERQVAQSAGKDGFSAAAREYAQSGKAVQHLNDQVNEVTARTARPTHVPPANYGRDAAALASTTAGSALMGGVAEGAFGDKSKSFDERFREGAMHGALGGLVIGAPNLAFKHWARANAGKNQLADTMTRLYNSQLYTEREGSLPNSFITGGKKGLAIGLGMDSITGFSTPKKQAEKSAHALYMEAIKAAGYNNEFLHGYWKGMTLGTGAGAATGALAERNKARREGRRPEYAKKMLFGAGLGAAGGTVLQAAGRHPADALDVMTTTVILSALQ